MFEGTVKRVTDFGAFIDFGAASDGLVHKSQLSDEFVTDVSEFIQEGTKVRGSARTRTLEVKIPHLTCWSETSLGERAGDERGHGEEPDLSLDEEQKRPPPGARPPPGGS